MARPVTICEEAVLQAARDVFLARGIRATTAEVAQAAGISEGSIFKRYKSKAELFEAALASLVELEPPFIAGLGAKAGAGDIRGNLVQLGLDLFAYFSRVVPAYMLAWSNPGPEGLPTCLSGPCPMPIRLLAAIQQYFQAEIELGRLAPRSAEVLARLYVGAIHNYVVFQHFFSQKALPERDFLEGLVLVLSEGMLPANHATPAPSGHRKASK